MIKDIDRIEFNLNICGGKPVIRGTRIPVTVILDQLANGDTWELVLKGFPELEKEDIQEALECAKSSMENTELISSQVGYFVKPPIMVQIDH